MKSIIVFGVTLLLVVLFATGAGADGTPEARGVTRSGVRLSLFTDSEMDFQILRSLGADAPPCSYEDLEASDCVMIVGSNMAYAHPVLFRRLEEAKAKLVEMAATQPDVQLMVDFLDVSKRGIIR